MTLNEMTRISNGEWGIENGELERGDCYEFDAVSLFLQHFE